MDADDGILRTTSLNLSLPTVGDQRGRSTCTLTSATIVGRSDAADLTLDDPTVSRRHAEFYLNLHGAWRVRDLGSHNGVSVNGRPIQDQTIHIGDVVHIGNVPLKVGATDTPQSTSSETRSTLDIRPSEPVTIGRLDSPEQSKIDANQLFLVQKMAKRLLDEPDPQNRLTLLCRQMLGPPLGAHHAAVVEFANSATGGATLVAGPETMSDHAKDSFYLSRSVVEALRASNEPVLASNSPARDQAAAKLSMVTEKNHFAVAACPLAESRASQDTQRVLYVVLPALLGSMEWLALAALAAEQYNHAEIAWRGRAAAAEQAVIDRDLRQAHRIQLALVPNRVEIPGLEVALRFKPCRAVGGDYVDAFQLPDSRALLVVADVAGKGMQAALIASSLHTWLHATVACTGDLGESITLLNRYLCQMLPDGTFATLIAITIDPNTGDMEYVNAGHPPILIGSTDGAVRDLLTGSNTPIGVVDTAMKIDRDRLKEGERLLLYTDGLTESLNSDGAWLGVEGVGRCLSRVMKDKDARNPAETIAVDLIGIIERETTGYDADDRTLLIATRI